MSFVVDGWKLCDTKFIMLVLNVGIHWYPVVGFDSRIIVNSWPFFTVMFSFCFLFYIIEFTTKLTLVVVILSSLFLIFSTAKLCCWCCCIFGSPNVMCATRLPVFDSIIKKIMAKDEYNNKNGCILFSSIHYTLMLWIKRCMFLWYVFFGHLFLQMI